MPLQPSHHGVDGTAASSLSSDRQDQAQWYRDAVEGRPPTPVRCRLRPRPRTGASVLTKVRTPFAQGPVSTSSQWSRTAHSRDDVGAKYYNLFRPGRRGFTAVHQAPRGRRDVIGAADRQVGRVRVRVDPGVPQGIRSADGFVDPLLDPITSWLISFHYGT